jgi:hypothetical protein
MWKLCEIQIPVSIGKVTLTIFNHVNIVYSCCYKNIGQQSLRYLLSGQKFADTCSLCLFLQVLGKTQIEFTAAPGRTCNS